jgi:hypothetical protein
MNDLAAPFRQLVERRLWPLAVLLVAALAAVPILLSKSGAEPVAPLPTAATAPASDAEDTVVSLADAESLEADRKVLGSRKNPFRPAIKAKKAQEEETTTTGSHSTTTVDLGDPGTGGSTGSTGGGTFVPGTPGVTPPDIPRPAIELYSLAVRFGESTGTLEERLLKRLKGLPGGSNPKVVYLGLLGDHKTAVFLVDADVTVQGDGKCEPSPLDCQTLRMKKGDTVFLDVGEGAEAKQFQLDLVGVVTRKVRSQVLAASARASVAKGGRAALRERLGRIGRYRYSEREGVLKVASVKAWKASVAKASAAAAAERD